jgi:hypothetical protein
VTHLQFGDTPFQGIAHRLNAVHVGEIYQELPFLARRAKYRVDPCLPQHPHRILKLLVGDIERVDEPPKLAPSTFVRMLHAPSELLQHAHFIVDEPTQKTCLGAQHDRLFVYLAGVG